MQVSVLKQQHTFLLAHLSTIEKLIQQEEFNAHDCWMNIQNLKGEFIRHCFSEEQAIRSSSFYHEKDRDFMVYLNELKSAREKAEEFFKTFTSEDDVRKDIKGFKIYSLALSKLLQKKMQMEEEGIYKMLQMLE